MPMSELRGPWCGVPPLSELSEHIRAGADLAVWRRPPHWGQCPVLRQSTRKCRIFLQCRVPEAPSRRWCGIHSLLLLGWGQLPRYLPATSAWAELIGAPGRCREVTWGAVLGLLFSLARAPGTVTIQKPSIPLWGSSALSVSPMWPKESPGQGRHVESRMLAEARVLRLD